MDKKFIKTTEEDSNYRHIEKMAVEEILVGINNEDLKVAHAVTSVIPQIANLSKAVAEKLIAGGRLFYIGAGTSGRVAVVDACECPPTFGVPPELVTAIIAGGKNAMFKAVEYAEDDIEAAWKDLTEQNIGKNDFVIGIAASGTTPYVIGGLRSCKENNISTGSVVCNIGAPISAIADYPIEVSLGPEFLTGSTRMKSGTAQKLILNMISTSVMIQLGRVEDNKMVNMQLTNEKLIERGIKMLMEKKPHLGYDEAKKALLQHGSVSKAVISMTSSI